MTDTLTPRLLGPNHNRLLEVTDKSDARAGTVDELTAAFLRSKGWSDYIGPARSLHGWVVEGTDPALKPTPIWRPTPDRGVNGA